MTTSVPKGYYQYALAIDCETSGMAFCADDPSVNAETGEMYQMVSVGLIVVDTRTIKPVKELYLEISMDPKYAFTESAYKVHGLSKKYLHENGVTPEEAVVEIANLIYDYWADKAVILLGQNVASFDIWFLKRLLRDFDLNIRFAHRHIDTSTLGFTVFGVYNSDDLFDQIGIPARDPGKHNALDDARYSLKVVQTVRALAYDLLGGVDE